MEAWAGLIGAIAGGAVAWGLAQATQIITARRKAASNLKIAAFICLDRLYKIRTTNELRQSEPQKYEEIYLHEIYLLGSDLVRYLDYIAAGPKMWKRHWDIYCQMRPILIKHDVATIGNIIEELEKFLELGQEKQTH